MRSRSNAKVLVRWISSWHWGAIVAASVLIYLSFRWALPLLAGEGVVRDQLRSLGELLATAGATVLLALAPLSWMRRRKERRLIEALRDVEGLRKLSWWDLEVLVRAIYDRQGFKAKRIGGDGADGGVDVRLTRGSEVILVQCKQWRARQVPVAVVRELLGSMTAERAQRGIVVTCGTFTGDAWGFAAANGIELVDGLKLVEMVRSVAGAMPVSASPEQGSTTGALPCPKCGGLMVKRWARGRGGEGVFMGCTRFPVCKGTRPVQES